MLNTSTTISFNGSSTTDEGIEVLNMDARLEYDGSLNFSERYPDRERYLANKATADKDYEAFRTYVDGVISKLDKEVTSNETV